jgi:hypothetical protein
MVWVGAVGLLSRALENVTLWLGAEEHAHGRLVVSDM